MARFDVTIAGELNLDLILYGLPDVLTPERELLATEMLLTLGSSSAILAHNLASLGCKVGFGSCMGADSFGEIALDFLRAAGVDVSTVSKLENGIKTGLSVLLPHVKWRKILTYPGAMTLMNQRLLDQKFLSSSRHFHLSSYYLQPELHQALPNLYRSLKTAGLTLSLDTNDDPDDLWSSNLQEVLPFVDVFLPNEREAKKISQRDDLESAIAHLADVVPLVVVKLGSQGAIARRGKEIVRCPALKLEAIVDTVGAGDSFDAGFLFEFVKGSDLETCLRTGNLAGALSTTRAGGIEAFRDSAHLEEFLRRHGEHR